MKQPVAGNSEKMAAIITRVARTFGAGAGFISVNPRLYCGESCAGPAFIRIATCSTGLRAAISVFIQIKRLSLALLPIKREQPSTIRDEHHEKPVINQHSGQQPVAG
jgi:hypothetical protein